MIFFNVLFRFQQIGGVLSIVNKVGASAMDEVMPGKQVRQSHQPPFASSTRIRGLCLRIT